ncbi:hypothetical protein [Oleispirillum naphthae]|uniref:hypothetical protein n=1 Tax=Oleispirillum naphthae TaxID=2838853 RepID=UPI0030826387
MSTLILQNDGLSSISWQQTVYSQIVARKQQEIAATSEKLQESYDAKSVYFDSQSNQLARIKASISNAGLAVENGQEGLTQIKDYLLQMRIILGNYPSSDSPDLMKDEFDAYVDKINNAADLYAKDYNPIGNVVSTDWTPNTISFTTSTSGHETAMQGVYAGTDYYIEDSEGHLWVPDPGTSTIAEYTDYKTTNPADSEKGDGFASTRTGMRLDSYDAETGAITFTVNPDNEALSETVSGTITFGGTGVMQSWFYEGLDTEEGRTAALEAIDRAENLISASEAQLANMSTNVTRADANIDSQLDDLKGQRSEALREQMVANYQQQVKQQQELQILQTTFANMETQTAYYKSLFTNAGVSVSPLFDFTA